MTRSRILAAVGIALVLTLTGCDSGDPEPVVVAATTPAPEPTPTSSPVDLSRDGCSRLSALDTVDFDPSRNLAVGRAAAQATHPGIAQAGEALEEAASRPDAAVPGDGPIAISEAQMDLAGACIVVFGDGPW